MAALRQRLIEDIQVRNYSPRAVEAYVSALAKLAMHFMRSPEQLSSEDLRTFQVHRLRQIPPGVSSIRSCAGCASFA